MSGQLGCYRQNTMVCGMHRLNRIHYKDLK
jgi:hypothetical protein